MRPALIASIKKTRADKEIKSQWRGWQGELLDRVGRKDLSVVTHKQKMRGSEARSPKDGG